MAFDADQTLTVDAERVAWREVGDEVVVMDVARNHYLSLNGSGAALWKRLDTGATPAELAGELVDTYGIERDVADADVVTFLRDLHERGLLSAGA